MKANIQNSAGSSLRKLSSLIAGLAVGSSLCLSACSTTSMGKTSSYTPSAYRVGGPVTLTTFYSTALYRGRGYNDYGLTSHRLLIAPTAAPVTPVVARAEQPPAAFRLASN